MLKKFISSRYAQFTILRKKCPFWAGLFLLISGFAMLLPAVTDLSIGNITLTISNNAGVKIILLSVVLWICGIAMWVNPAYRMPAGIVGLITGILSLQAANFGGFGVGLICSVIGSALGLSWYSQASNEEDSHESVDDTFSAQEDHDSILKIQDAIPTKSADLP